jgi:hypothetical protein
MIPIEKWLNPQKLNEIYTTEYWNDIKQEESKPWWIENENFVECKSYLKKQVC